MSLKVINKGIEKIKSLEKEVQSLREELARLRERERELEDTRRAMLYILEDLNETGHRIIRAKREWEITFDAIKDPICIHDEKYRIIRANRAYREAAGMPYEDFIGKPYYEIFPVTHKPICNCVEGEQRVDVLEEVTVRKKKTYRLKFYPARDKMLKEFFSVHVLEDITDQRRAEEELKSSFEKLWEEKERTSNLLMIAHATAHTTDRHRLIEEVVTCSNKIIGCDTCIVYLWDMEEGAFRFEYAKGLPEDVVSLFRTTPVDREFPLIKEVMDRGAPTVYSDVEEGLRGSVFEVLKNIKGALFIPFQGRTGPLGFMLGIFARDGYGSVQFAQRELELFHGIADQVSLSLEEARLYKESVDKAMELSHKIETIRVMHEIDRYVLSTLKPSEILDTVTRMISLVVPADGTAILLTDEDTRQFVYASGYAVKSFRKGERISRDDVDITMAVRTGNPVFEPNFKDKKSIKRFEETLLKEGFSSSVMLPLVVRKEAAGVLIVLSHRPSGFVPEDLSTLEKISTQLSVALENARLVEDLEELFWGTVRTLTETIDAKSRWTAGHSRRVAEFSVAIGKELGMGERELKRLELAALLHDIGKIGVYESILDKPARLSKSEIEIMRQHPVKGAEILKPIKQLGDIIPAIRHHHEWYNGKGYPDGIKADEIPLFARIIAVADTVDAMSSDRPYRKALSKEAIVEELKRFSGVQFDPQCVGAFIAALYRGGVSVLHK